MNITTAGVLVTPRCTLSCPRCFLRHRNMTTPWGDTTLDELEEFVHRLTSAQIRLTAFGFSGGEPTLWKPLRWATGRVAKQWPGITIGINTNGFNAHLADYGSANRVFVADYGGINRLDIVRLKSEARKAKGTKVIVHHPIQRPLPTELDPGAVPASCSCSGLCLAGKYVYPCGIAASLLDRTMAVPLREDFVTAFRDVDPFKQSLCLKCVNNRQWRRRHNVPQMLEWCLWNGDHGGMADVSWLARAWHRLRGRRPLVQPEDAASPPLRLNNDSGPAPSRTHRPLEAAGLPHEREQS